MMKKFIFLSLFILSFGGYSFAETVKLSAEVEVHKCALSFGGSIKACEISSTFPKTIELELAQKNEKLWTGYWSKIVEREDVRFLGVVHVEKHQLVDVDGNTYFSYKVGGATMGLLDDTPEDFIPPAKVSTWVSSLDSLNTLHLSGDSVVIGSNGSVGGDIFELRPLLHFGPPLFSLKPTPKLPTE